MRAGGHHGRGIKVLADLAAEGRLEGRERGKRRGQPVSAVGHAERVKGVHCTDVRDRSRGRRRGTSSKGFDILQWPSKREESVDGGGFGNKVTDAKKVHTVPEGRVALI